MASTSLDLFRPVVEPEKQHPIFRQICAAEYAPERDVLTDWSDGFIDRDGKFVKEFQTSFESSMWELYVFASIKSLGGKVDFQHSSPDFVSSFPSGDLCIEATVTQPAFGAPPAYGVGPAPVPDDLNKFNVDSTLRLCSRFTAKAEKYDRAYSLSSHVKGKPYVIALASFDKPNPQLAANRPIIAALYGVYFDEEFTLSIGSPKIFQHPIDGVTKSPTADVPAAYFTDSKFEQVSAVLYSPSATWGKIRALANAPDARTIYTTLHPNSDSLIPEIRTSFKTDYEEHLLDGLYVLHNPYAKHPLSINVFDHERIAQFVTDEDGSQRFIAPDDFLLLRMLQSFVTR